MENEAVPEYLDRIYQTVEEKNANETEFHQAVKEVFDSIKPILEENDHFIDHAILERLVEPERMLTFQVPWIDDQGN